jgi:hypothetical protein
MEIALNNKLAGPFAEQLLNYRLRMRVFRRGAQEEGRDFRSPGIVL